MRQLQAFNSFAGHLCKLWLFSLWKYHMVQNLFSFSSYCNNWTHEMWPCAKGSFPKVDIFLKLHTPLPPKKNKFDRRKPVSETLYSLKIKCWRANFFFSFLLLLFAWLPCDMMWNVSEFAVWCPVSCMTSEKCITNKTNTSNHFVSIMLKE